MLQNSTYPFPDVDRRYDVIVIGGGHAGAEAAWAAAGMGATVALVTMDPSKIGAMSCNPAIGGLAKGQIVREVDALGGLMGRAIDATGIQFRVLNSSRGAAVQGPRAQADKHLYAREVQRLLSTRPTIEVIAGIVDELIVEDGLCVGVVVDQPGAWASSPCEHARSRGLRARTGSPCSRILRLGAGAVVLTTGTFMRGLMHTGEMKTRGGRAGEGSAVGISGMLQRLGFELGRLKTGTPPRLATDSIDFAALEEQCGDAEPRPFSEMTGVGEHGLPARVNLRHAMIHSHGPEAHAPEGRFPALPQVCCYTTHTNERIHEIIRANLHRAPMYSGRIEAECGPRYCPSIEDKIVRFADRTSHHVFLEPECLHQHFVQRAGPSSAPAGLEDEPARINQPRLIGDDIYCNGISTSLPADVQEQIVRLMPGCEKARIVRYGYAVEYDMVWPHQIDATGMTKRLEGLFLAGQINGTSGYEEAAGQGVVAGINAARFARGDELLRLGRETSYIGVMLDDLVTRTPREPYRMFTSRAEYRLLLRADNAPDRLTPLGREIGTVCDERWRRHVARSDALAAIRRALEAIRVEGRTLREHVRRRSMSAEDVRKRLARQALKSNHRGTEDTEGTQRGGHGLDVHAPTTESLRALSVPSAALWFASLLDVVLNDIHYEGYVARQLAEVKRMSEMEHRRIPAHFSYETVTGLRAEAREVLAKFRPATLGQSARLPGVNPADVTLLAVALQRPQRARRVIEV